MYLSSVELTGFKSFAHKTKVMFHEGITAIVGPNGCGKTNIVDSIRWVLGEQKSSVLRSDKMENVIFGGTMNRRRLGFAEVSLVIENTKNILPSEYSEIMITRRLYRSGESDYLLNKQICRLKDISNLLMDSGMGADAYSVIELSMIELLLNDKDDYRKRLFEEASGITKYKAKRQEALRKLEATRQDVVRVKDIITEIERNVNSLRNQVNRASRYERMKTELVEVEKQYYNCKRVELMDRKVPLESEIKEISNRLASLSGKSVKNKAIIEKTQNEILEKQEKLANAQDKLNKFTELVRSTDSNLAKLQERLLSLNETKTRLLSEKFRLEVKLKEHNGRIKHTKIELDEIKLKFQNAEVSFKKSDVEREKFLINYRKGKAVIAEKSQSAIDIIKELEASVRKKDTVERDILEKTSHIEELYEKIKDASEKLDGLRQKSSMLKKDVESLTSKENLLKSNIQKEKELLDKSEVEIRILESRQNNLNISLESQRTKHDFLVNLTEEYEGMPGGIVEVLRAKSKLQGILGTVGELIDVPAKYTKAVEASLGEQAYYVVVDKYENVISAINYLQKSQAGGVTFLAIDRIRATKNKPGFDGKNKGKSEHNGFSPLIEKISFQNKYDSLYTILIGDVLFSENGDVSWKNEYSNLPGNRFVDSNGNILTSGSIFTKIGSDNDDSTSIIGRKERISEIEKNIKSLSKDLDKTAVTIKNQNDLITKTKIKIEDYDKQYGVVSQKSESLKQTFLVLDYEIQQLTQNIVQHNSEIELHKTFLKSTPKIDAIIKNISKIEKIRDNLQLERLEFQAKEESLENERQTIEKLFAENQANVTRLNQIFLNSEKDILRLNNLQEEYADDLKNRHNSLEEAEAQSKLTQKQIDKFEKELESLFEEQREYESRVLTSREELALIQGEKKDDIDEFMNLQNQLSSVQSEIQSRKEQLVEFQQELKFLKDTLLSKGISPDNIEIDNEEMDLDAIINRKQKLIRTIELHGPVNLEALDEYDKERERLTFLQKQASDLDDAENILIKTIDKINQTAREKYVQTFQLVRQHFVKIFRSFFSEGEAEMKMEESADPLEAKIEIFAQPFGKKITSINLLSGGEKALTAIAILFAVYRVKPSPFCIFDEVDAPLDDANITRFTNVLNEFSKDTQFIVVTHNKKTMEAARNLYGVTMEETGISKLISVRLDSERSQKPSDKKDLKPESLSN